MIYVITPQYKAPEGSIVINTTSRSDNWSKSLSPFFLGPVKLYGEYKSINVENGWQYSKVYEYYLDDGEPGERYFEWAKAGWNNTKAVRYPMGKGAVPEYSYWDGKKLSYVDARKQIYIPLYSNAVKETHAFSKLKQVYKSNESIYLVDFDAHNLIADVNFMELFENPNIKVGHAYVLAMMLKGEI